VKTVARRALQKLEAEERLLSAAYVSAVAWQRMHFRIVCITCAVADARTVGAHMPVSRGQFCAAMALVESSEFSRLMGLPRGRACIVGMGPCGRAPPTAAILIFDMIVVYDFADVESSTKRPLASRCITARLPR